MLLTLEIDAQAVPQPGTPGTTSPVIVAAGPGPDQSPSPTASSSASPAVQAPAQVAAQELLLDGVRAFRAERYDEALALFRRVEAAQSSPDIGFYLGMTLHKLARHGEALTAFRPALRGGMREPVADYYQAVSCYRLGMLERARQIFSALISEPKDREAANTPVLGPRLKEGAQRFLQTLDQTRPPEAAAKQLWLARQSDGALQRIDAELASGHAESALEWLDEVARLVLQLANRGDKLTAVQQRAARLRELLRGKPSEADAAAIAARLNSGGGAN